MTPDHGCAGYTRAHNSVLRVGLGSQEIAEFEHKPTMTCRIDRLVTGEGLVILRISGQIRGEEVDMLRAVLKQERSQVALDLKDVLIVDREAVKLLALSESKGAELRHCPAYIREWVTKEADTMRSNK